MKSIKALGGEIPIYILKESKFIFKTLTKYIKKSIEIGCFLDSPIEENIIPTF